MASANERTDVLAHYIERWLAQGPRRSLQTLSRNTHIPYPTLRRIMQREGEPTLDTVLTLLNLVATLDEAMDYLKYNKAVKQFYEKISSQTTLAKPEVLERFSGKDAFWILCLGLTLGATRERVQNLLGLSGLAILDEMVAEGLLKESEFEIYRTDAESSTLFFHSAKIGREAVGHVNDMPPNGRFFEQVIVCNVNEKGLEILMDSLKDAFEKGAEAAKEQEGDILVSFAYIGKEVMRLNKKGEAR